jgi:integrase
MWIASMLDKGLKHRTVTQYIAGLKYHWASMRTSYSALENMIALQRQLQAAKKTNNAAVRTRSALGYEQLIAMKSFIRNEPDDAMLWAAMTLAVAGLLRSGEFTSVRGVESLRMSALHIDKQRSSMSITLPRDKTTSSPVPIHIAATRTATCPVDAMVRYLSYWRNIPPDAPLFEWSNGQPLTQSSLVLNMQRLLTAAGVPNADQYTGHSFRRGGATALANCNTSMHVLQKAGRWTSNAAQRYIDTSARDVAAAQVRAAQSVSSAMGSASSTRR